MTEPIVRLRNVSIGFPTPAGGVDTVVRDLSLEIGPGERIGLIGPSGCGKSLTALAMLGLVPPPGRVIAGRIEICGVDLGDLGAGALRAHRGGTIGLVLQESEAALNPVLSIGRQVEEVIEAHRTPATGDIRQRARELLASVDLEADRIRSRAPHSLSGGQRQRAQIAIALAADPSLLIADEPTSSLDVLTQARILHLLDERCRSQGVALLLISHDPDVVAAMVDTVIEMDEGRIVTQGPLSEYLAAADPRPVQLSGRGLS